MSDEVTAANLLDLAERWVATERDSQAELDASRALAKAFAAASPAVRALAAAGGPGPASAIAVAAVGVLDAIHQTNVATDPRGAVSLDSSAPAQRKDAPMSADPPEGD